MAGDLTDGSKGWPASLHKKLMRITRSSIEGAQLWQLSSKIQWVFRSWQRPNYAPPHRHDLQLIDVEAANIKPPRGSDHE